MAGSWLSCLLGPGGWQVISGSRPEGRGSAILWHPAGAVGARLLLSSVLLYAGLSKAGHAGELARIVYGYRILHPDLVNLAAITLPWIELSAGALLLVGLLRPSAAVVAGGLLGAFIVAVGLAMARGIEAPCGCFSLALTGERIGWWLLARDGILALLGVYLVLHPARCLEMDSLLG